MFCFVWPLPHVLTQLSTVAQQATLKLSGLMPVYSHHPLIMVTYCPSKSWTEHSEDGLSLLCDAWCLISYLAKCWDHLKVSSLIHLLLELLWFNDWSQLWLSIGTPTCGLAMLLSLPYNMAASEELGSGFNTSVLALHCRSCKALSDLASEAIMSLLIYCTDQYRRRYTDYLPFNGNSVKQFTPCFKPTEYH